jgi:hypothetical protein
MFPLKNSKMHQYVPGHMTELKYCNQLKHFEPREHPLTEKHLPEQTTAHKSH